VLCRVVKWMLTDVSVVLTASIIRAIVAVHTSETSTNVYFTTRQFILDDSKLHIRRRENLKSHLVNLYGEATLFVSYWAEYL
jgi:hypothetical protein